MRKIILLTALAGIFVLLALTFVSADYYYPSTGYYNGYYNTYSSHTSSSYGGFYGPQYSKSTDYKTTTKTMFLNDGGYKQTTTTTKTVTQSPQYQTYNGYSYEPMYNQYFGYPYGGYGYGNYYNSYSPYGFDYSGWGY